MTQRKALTFAQALIDTGKQDVDCSITPIPYEELKYEDLEFMLEDVSPLGLSAGYWKDSTRLAVLAIVSAEKGVVIEFPEPSRRPLPGSAQTVDPDSESYQVLQNLLAARPAGEFFAFDIAPLSMVLFVEQGLRLTNAVDIQSAFPDINRYSIVAVLKAALGETKIWESNLATAFDNIIYNPESRVAVLEPVKRAWLAQYLGSEGNAIMTYSNVKRVNTAEMDDAVSRSSDRRGLTLNFVVL